jgi:hypothetical protein
VLPSMSFIVLGSRYRPLRVHQARPHIVGLMCAYRRRRCILPVDGFFEWKANKGQKAKQPYAVAMTNSSWLGAPFQCGG